MDLGDANTGQQHTTTSMPMDALVESSEPDEAGNRGLGHGHGSGGSRPLKTLTELLSCPCEVCSQMTNKMPDRQDHSTHKNVKSNKFVSHEHVGN